MRTPLLLALLALTLVIGGYVAGCEVAHSGYASQERQSQRALDSLRLATAKIDTLYARDTVIVRRAVDRWHTLLKTIPPIDTLPVPGAALVPVPGPVVREIVRIGDSTITACTRVLHDCEALRGTLTAQRDSLQTALVRARKPPPRFGCTAGVTYTMGDLTDHRAFTDWANRLGITCGLRIHLF